MQAAREQAKTLGLPQSTYTYQYQTPCPSCGVCPTCGRSRNAYFSTSYPSVIYSNIPSTTATAAVPATSFHNH